MNPAIARERRRQAAYARQANQQCSTECCQVNVGEKERLASLVAGGVMVASGLLCRSTLGLTFAAFGAALAYRGYTGHCHLYDALDYSTASGSPELASADE